MSRATLEERVAALEKQVTVLLANETTGRSKNWRRTRGVITGDDLMKQVFEEGRKIREAESTRGQRRSGKAARRTLVGWCVDEDTRIDAEIPRQDRDVPGIEPATA